MAQVLEDIKSLTPSSFEHSALKGVVSLRWPYSSSQKTLQLQLAEEDVRKRSDRGQVRLAFNGAAAAALKDLPALTTLEISAAPGSAHFEEFQGSSKDVIYKIEFLGEVSVRIGTQALVTLDSRKTIPIETPSRVRRTWLTPDLKRSSPFDSLGIDETWFSESTPEPKRKRYSTNYQLIPNTQDSPSQAQALSQPSPAPITTSQGSELPASQRSERTNDLAPVESQISSQAQSAFAPTRFRFQSPSTPVRFEVAHAETTTPSQGVHKPSTAQTDTKINNEENLVGIPPNSEAMQEEVQVGQQPSHASSIQGEPAEFQSDHGTPYAKAHTLQNASNINSTPVTPRNVPYMSLESASEQEDFYRKLRASAPPKSEAGSSMVADEDDEAGNLAEDPKPTILETQSRIQEGILRNKISEGGHENRRDHSLDEEPRLHAIPQKLSASEIGLLDESNHIGDITMARSTMAAYSNSVDDRESIGVHGDSASKLGEARAGSPSMTERGAAVQESVFRSKIVSSEGNSNADHESVRSVKSSVVAEPAMASIDGSIIENHERSMLDQQASIQESLFREKVDNSQDEEHVGNLSLLGQAPAESSVAGDEVTNQEPSMLQQQSSIQDNIFRNKVAQSEDQTQVPDAPASLDHMEGNEVIDAGELLRDGATRSQLSSATTAQDLILETRPTEIAPVSRTIEEFHAKADAEEAVGIFVGDESHEQEAHDFLDMEVEAEPEGHLSPNAVINSPDEATQTPGAGVITESIPSAQDQTVNENMPASVIGGSSSIPVEQRHDSEHEVDELARPSMLPSITTASATLDRKGVPDSSDATLTDGQNETTTERLSGDLSPRTRTINKAPIQFDSELHDGSPRDAYAKGFEHDDDDDGNEIVDDEEDEPENQEEGDSDDQGDYVSDDDELNNDDEADLRSDVTGSMSLQEEEDVVQNIAQDDSADSPESDQRDGPVLAMPSSTAEDPIEIGSSVESEESGDDANQSHDDVLSQLSASQSSAGQDTNDVDNDIGESNEATIDGQFQTELAFYEDIRNLAYDRVVDLMGLCHDCTISRTAGPDYLWHATIIQPSRATVEVSLFRRSRQMMPEAQNGDVVLLRNFRVLSFSRQLYLKSQAESACARLVPTAGDDLGTTPAHWNIVEANSPVECGEQEFVQAHALRQWWTRKGHKVLSSLKPKRQRVSLGEIEHGKFYDLEASIYSLPTTMTTPYTILVTESTRAAADEAELPSASTDKNIQGSNGQQIVIPVDLRMQDARYVHTQCSQNSTILLKNVLIERRDQSFSGSIKPAVSGSVSIVKL